VKVGVKKKVSGERKNSDKNLAKICERRWIPFGLGPNTREAVLSQRGKNLDLEAQKEMGQKEMDLEMFESPEGDGPKGDGPGNV